MDDIQALNSIYAAARLAPLNANDHEAIRKLYDQLSKVVSPKDDGKVVELPKGP